MRTTAVLIFLALALTAHAQQKDTQQSAAQHHGDVTKRGEQAMGFSQEKTTHHFLLFKDGGAIEVETNDPKDTDSLDQIRQHLSHIARMFSNGNFDMPMFIHGTTPPGVPTMTQLHDQIHYEFQETSRAAKVRITTANAQALEAIHSFLRFQIADHQTGDSGKVTDESQKK
jgi:hypothetical protein